MARIVFATPSTQNSAGPGANVRVLDGLLINTPQYAALHAARQATIDTRILEFQTMANAMPEHSSARKNLEFQVWCLNRIRGISGTAAGTIMGLNPYDTAYQYWKQATMAEPFVNSGNAATEWGQRKEPVIAQKYLDLHGCYAMVPPSIVSPLIPFMTASADRIVLGSDGAPERILEIKTTSFNREYDGERQWGKGNTYADVCDAIGKISLKCTQEDGTVPAHYIVQVMHYMAATGVDKADIAVLIGSSDYREFTIHLDPQQAEDLIRAEDEFYCRHILDNVAPAYTAVDLSKIRPEKAASIEATEQVVEIANNLRDIRAQLDALKAKESELRDQLVEFVGTNEAITHNGTTLLTYGTRERAAAFDSKRFEVEHPDLYAQYLGQPSFSRVFSFKLK